MTHPKKPYGKRKVRVPWADHVLRGQQRRTSARPMKLAPKKVK